MGANPASGTNENGHLVDPPPSDTHTQGGPRIQNRTRVENQLMTAELCLYKKNKKTKTQKKQLPACYIKMDREGMKDLPWVCARM